MKKVVAAAVLGCLLGVVDQALAGEFTIYGFVRFDAVIDDSRMQSHQFGFWVKPEPPDAEDDGNLTMYPRLTRLGVRFKPVKLDEVSTISGLVEVDFQNGGSESRQILRLRQAYFNLQRGDWHFLAGQAWDVISPIFPIANNDGLMWHAGNLGDRHPQVRLRFKPEGGVSLAVAAGQTGAVDRKDLDKNGILDGWDAALPFLQARLGLELPKFKAGGWAHRGAEETGAPVGGDNKTRFTSAAVGLDASISLTDKLTVQGEGWTGRNLTDIRGGIGQGVNTSTGEEIASTGGWAQIVVIPNAQWKLYAGATMEQPDEEAVPNGGRTRNGAYYAVGRYRPWKPFQVAVEYLYWKTTYKGLNDGIANRLDIHFTYNF